jgi:HlyD family secretion protein
MKRASVGLALLLTTVAGGFFGYSFLAGGGPDAAPQIVAVAEAQDAARAITAEAIVEPATSAELRFEVGGTLAELLVEEGQEIAKGQPLARLDTRDLELRVGQAQAALAQAQAAYDELVEGATDEQIAVAETQLAQAQGQLSQVVGAVTESDLAAARANLAQARTALAELEAGPEQTEIQADEARVAAARAEHERLLAQIQQTRDSASRAKLDAEHALAQASLVLEQAQSRYSLAYWNYHGVQQDGRAPAVGEGQSNPELSDYGNLSAQEAFRQAELELRAAEVTLGEAQLALEHARQNEVTLVAQAEQQALRVEAQLREAEAALAELLDGAEAEDLSRARAAVAEAQATLDSLVGEQRAGSLDAAAAGVANAEARLADLTADARTTELASAKARVQQAEVGLRQAEVALDKATLYAPIDGTAIEVNLELGEVPGEDEPALVVADLSRWEIETDDLTELDIVAVREGAPVALSFDALPGLELPGTVLRIEGIGKNREGDITYAVTVAPDAWDARLRWKMTAIVTILP